jgi:hypothetical protein
MDLKKAEQKRAFIADRTARMEAATLEQAVMASKKLHPKGYAKRRRFKEKVVAHSEKAKELRTHTPSQAPRRVKKEEVQARRQALERERTRSRYGVWVVVVDGCIYVYRLGLAVYLTMCRTLSPSVSLCLSLSLSLFLSLPLSVSLSQ